MTELKNIKEGDEVYLTGRMLEDVGTILKVTRVTNTMIICGKYRYRKNNGYAIGDFGSYSFPHITILTDEIKNKVRHNVLWNTIRRFDFQKLNIEQLEKIKGIIKDAADPQNNGGK